MPDPVAASGYEHSKQGEEVLRKALKTANAILALSSEFALTGRSDQAPAKTGTKSFLSVYSVKPTKPPFVIQVPFRSCNCIFFQDEEFRKSLTGYSTRLKQMLEIEPSDMLSFMILHEVGHVANGDLGQFDKEGPDYNVTDTEQKQRERRADEFAVKAILKAKDDKKSLAFLDAMSVELAITKASWNLAALRVLGSFGGSVLCSRSLFQDRGSSHPNFELRILVANDIDQNTSESRELLSSFEDCRAAPDGRPSPPR
jgi:hypothetical protein